MLNKVHQPPLHKTPVIRGAFEYKGLSFLVQSYLENDFANICQCNGESFRIDFTNKVITTSAKETKEWLSIASKIEIEEIKQIIKNLCSQKWQKQKD